MESPPDDSDETRRLLELIAAGQLDAFDPLFERHRDLLVRFVGHRIGPRLQARLDPSDVVQETHLEAFRRLQDYLSRRPMAFHVWLRRTAYERLLMLRRRHLGAHRRAAGLEEALPEQSSAGLARRLMQSGTSPSRRIDRAERIEQVQRALARLLHEDLEILLMRDFEDLPYAEIAALLDTTPAAARKRHGRALLRLSQLLAEAGFGRSADE